MPRRITHTNTYADKLIKLIPAEWVSAYIAIKGILDSAQVAAHGVYYVIIGLLAVLLPFYLLRVLGVESRKQIIVTTISFLVWVFSVGGEHVGAISWYQPYQGSMLLIIWTLAVPVFIVEYSGTPRPQ